ncbi:Protein M3 [Entophlyctis luteolus]|nr:Protein M3 [Entophlyctis luteolus]
MARTGTISASNSKLISTILLNVLYPALLFTKVVEGVSLTNIASFGIMTVASAVILAFGFVFGLIVLKLGNPPEGFRYGAVLATTMGNYGDMILAIILTVANNAPFSDGDSAKGVAYVAAFIFFANLFLFTVGFESLGKDFKHMLPPVSQNEVEIVTPKSLTSSNIDAETVQVEIHDDERFDKQKFLASLKHWVLMCLNPNMVATVVGLFVTLIPALRNLFYDGNTASTQPLGFLFNALELVGNGAVAIGLLNVGSALGRLQFKNFAPTRVILGITLSRLILMPVIGIVVTQALARNGIIDANDKMMQFVIMLECATPTASTVVYMTQYWHPRGEADAIASVIVVEYCVALVTMTMALAVSLSVLA